VRRLIDHYASRAARRRSILTAITIASFVVAGVLNTVSPARAASNALRVSSHVTSAIRLEWPAGLAAAPNGNLIIADQRLNEVLLRLPSGTLRVIAGTGRAGFGGDDGPALSAQLRMPTALALAPNGTIYVDDQGNNRVRALMPNGRIMTVAGNGGTKVANLKVGSLATAVAMLPSALAIGRNGQLFVATGNDLVELSHAGVILKVINLNTTPGVKMRYPVCDPVAIGFDGTGNLYLGCDSRELIERMTNGRFAVVESHYRPHDFAGMALTKGGALLIANGEELLGIIDHHATPLIGLKTFPHSVVCVPSGVAVSTNGTIYTDCQSGDGFDTGAGLVKITPGGGIVLLRLWKGQ
jgi:hypothetical protein